MSPAGPSTIELPPDLGALGLLAQFLEEFAEANGIPPGPLLQLNLALDELVTNAITHGGSSEPLSLVLRLSGDRLQAELTDRGRRFDPLREAPPPDLDSPLEERRVGGLGIHMVKKMMDLVDYQWTGDRNRVRIEKRLDSPPAGDPPRSDG
ncbi:MAG: ATP-binding protein [Alphaproteobacteria bacterium]